MERDGARITLDRVMMDGWMDGWMDGDGCVVGYCAVKVFLICGFFVSY
jgi:hypothetical protein